MKQEIIYPGLKGSMDEIITNYNIPFEEMKAWFECRGYTVRGENDDEVAELKAEIEDLEDEILYLS